MKIVAGAGRWSQAGPDGMISDTANHIVKRVDDVTKHLWSFCGQEFGTLNDGDMDDLTSIGFNRLCDSCLKCLAKAGIPAPKYEGITKWS